VLAFGSCGLRRILADGVGEIHPWHALPSVPAQTRWPSRVLFRPVEVMTPRRRVAGFHPLSYSLIVAVAPASATGTVALGLAAAVEPDQPDPGRATRPPPARYDLDAQAYRVT
jgi:hypothetical protein